jgi:1-acyl-sn-glycerol-3-phosphate acyltransferase
MERTPPPPGRFLPPFYWFASTLVRWFLRAFYGLRVTGQEHVPRRGACVISMNHISAWDPPVIGVATPREIHVMAKKELFSTWIGRRVLRGLRVYPVDREANDIAAIKETLRRLERGHADRHLLRGVAQRRTRGGAPGGGVLRAACGRAARPRRALARGATLPRRLRGGPPARGAVAGGDRGPHRPARGGRLRFDAVQDVNAAIRQRSPAGPRGESTSWSRFVCDEIDERRHTLA